MTEMLPAQEVVFIRVFVKQLNRQILSWVLVYQGLKNKNKTSSTHEKKNIKLKSFLFSIFEQLKTMRDCPLLVDYIIYLLK